jgi:hypothetical protein
MPSSDAASVVAPRTSRPRRWGIARIALLSVGAISILSATTRAANAQRTPEQSAERKPGWEFLVPTGAVVPMGGQRAAITRANLTAAQVSYVVRPALAVTATLGWARSRDIAAAGDPKLDLFTYDLGAEVRTPRWNVGHAMTFSPFAGAGAGARSYNYRRLDVDATHNVAVYGSAGGELGVDRVRVRLEVRDYVTGFKPLDGEGPTDARNDVVVMAGLRFARRQTGTR